MAYIGNSPGVSSQRLEDTFFATAGQTTFVATAGYVPGNVDVYRNGVKLANGTEFTASNGINVVLTTAAAAGDSVVLLSYIPRGLSDGYTKTEADLRYIGKDANNNAVLGGTTVAYQATNRRSFTLNGGAGGSEGAILAFTQAGVNKGYLFSIGNDMELWSESGIVTIGNNAATPVNIKTNNIVRLQIDGAGNAGLGVTPSAWSASWKAFQLGSQSALWSTGAGVFLSANNFNDGSNKYIGTGNATRYYQLNGEHVWEIAPSGTAGNTISFGQSMTLKADGTLLVGTTSTSPVDTSANGVKISGSGYQLNVQGFANVPVALGRASTTGSIIDFYYRGGSTVYVGAISTNGTTTAYNTTSDYRLKENVAPMTGALATVAALKPCTYNWKVDGSAGQGFIAHELQSVVPDCVTGEKDAVDAEGKPQYQGVDTSFLVATLVSAIQEQQALIASLTSRLEALETQ